MVNSYQYSIARPGVSEAYGCKELWILATGLVYIYLLVHKNAARVYIAATHQNRYPDIMLPNLQALQVFYGTIPLIGAFLIAVWTNNKRIDDMGKRIDDLRQDLTARIEALAIRLDNKIDGLEKRLIDRIERLERPLLKG